MNNAEYTKKLAMAEAAFEDIKAGKSVGLKNEDAIRDAIMKKQLRWGMTSKGGFKPLVPGDVDYDNGYASPREALHFVMGQEPTRTPEGKALGAAFAPVSQHRIEGDPVRTDQKSGIADYGQDALRLGTKFLLPIGLGMQMANPYKAALAAAGSSIGGSGANALWSKLRNDPYADDPGQALVTGAATGLGAALARSMTENRQAGRWANQKARDAFRNIGASKPEAQRLGDLVTERLVKGLPPMTWNDYHDEPLDNFFVRYQESPNLPVRIREIPPVIEGGYDPKTGEWKGGKIKPRKPITTTKEVKTTSTREKTPGPKAGASIETTTTVEPGKETVVKSGSATMDGRTNKKSTRTVTTTKLPEISNDEALYWLRRLHYNERKPGAIDDAKEFLSKAYLDPTSQEGRIVFGTGANRIDLPQADWILHVKNTSSPIMQHIVREKAHFDDPLMDEEWGTAKRERGKRYGQLLHYGKGETTPIVSPEQFANKRDKVTTKVKSKAALAAGFLLPIAAELGYRPIKETLE